MASSLNKTQMAAWRGASRYHAFPNYSAGRTAAMPKIKPPAAPHTLRDFVLWAERRFAQARLYFGHGTDNARDEAAWLVASVLDLPFEALDANAGRVLTTSEADKLRAVTEARIATRKPLAYLLHEAWFAGQKFYVDERVIVPRSLIGEFLPTQFRPWIDPTRVMRILDLCTGSGCIAIAAALAFPDAQVDAADVSPEALAVARINVDRFRLGPRVRLVQSDLFAQLANAQYDLILTNPPYVDARDMATLPKEYRQEPALALASGETGLDAIVQILVEAPAHLGNHGILVAEVGNSCVTLRQRYPKVPFTWLTSASGDDSVFLLDRAKLVQHAETFRHAAPA
jgi:ribosomal protein L3 glutamine methyltransferase